MAFEQKNRGETIRLKYIVVRYNVRRVLKQPSRDWLGDFRTDRRVLLLAALAVPIGVIGALVAKALLWLIAAITNLAFFHRLSTAAVAAEDHHLGAWVIIIPVIGALIIGLMARYGSEKIRGHGIPEALEAILLGRSLISPRVAVLKPLSSAISIGTGGPFGAEGPIIMTGGAFGSLFGQLFHLSSAERKTLLVAGAASGMAAIFATPVAAVLLAVELLLFEWKPRSFIPAAVAAIVAASLRVPLLGSGPIFPVAPHGAMSGSELIAALVVGLAAGLGSCLLTLLVYAFEDLFHKLPVHWMWWPAIGSLAVGVGGWLDPRVLGVGYGTIHALMLGKLIGATVISLLLLKALVWAVALGSGTSGGVLAPLLIIGGALGALLGQWLPAGDCGLWATVGMAAMMGGTMRSPLTGMIFTLELTHDLNAMPALLVACASALGVTVLLLRRSILTEKLARRGQHITREYGVDLFELMRVGDVMDRAIPTVPATVTIKEMSDRIIREDLADGVRHAAFVVDADGRLSGIITRSDVMRALRSQPDGLQTVAQFSQTRIIVTYADEPLYDAIAKMLKHDVGRLPVVDRAEPRRVLGYLGRGDVLAARNRHHEAEEVRGPGPLAVRLKLKWN
jgi:CIC family chloride channel protein